MTGLIGAMSTGCYKQKYPFFTVTSLGTWPAYVSPFSWEKWSRNIELSIPFLRSYRQFIQKYVQRLSLSKNSLRDCWHLSLSAAAFFKISVLFCKDI